MYGDRLAGSGHAAPVSVLDSAFPDNRVPSPLMPCTFDLGRVQYTLPAPLVLLAVSFEVLAMALSSNLIILGTSPSNSHSRKPTEISIHSIFLDPSGRHLVITSHQGENWYLYRGWKKPRTLKSFHKMVIESIVWSSE